MTLIKSISGIRGTIGDKVGEGLTPLDIVKFTSAYGELLKSKHPGINLKIVLGRDARQSGGMVSSLVSGTLSGMGIDVIDGGMITTPTTEMGVVYHQAQGGIILTASHNPGNWNALKLLNDKGEFISAEDGQEILEIADNEQFSYAKVENLGTTVTDDDLTGKHIEDILKLPEVDVEAIQKADLKVAIDCVNSVGGTSIPLLLEKLGVKNILPLYCSPTGEFPHNPEPLPEHLTEIADLIKKEKADVGFVVDPDVDRLAILCEDGTMFGEEYTIVAIADYLLSKKTGNTVSNLSSSRALRDITLKHGGNYKASAVGEVNVVNTMKETNAVFGGEGNGGVIFPGLHLGRDALVGIALFLTYLVKSGKQVSAIKQSLPVYHMVKNKVQLADGIDPDRILDGMKTKHSNENITDIDGVKIDFEDGWVHLRKSNTEPIIRIYAEGKTMEMANELAEKIMMEVREA